MRIPFKEANDDALGDFLRKSGIFPNGSAMSSDRIRAVEADAEYPFRHIVGDNFIDYEVTRRSAGTVTFEYSLNGDSASTIELSRAIFSGKDVGQILYDTVTDGIEHIVEQTSFDMSDVPTKEQLRIRSQEEKELMRKNTTEMLVNSRLFFNMHELYKDAEKALDDGSEFPFKHQQGNDVIEYKALPVERSSPTSEFLYSLNSQEEELLVCNKKEVGVELGKYLLSAALKEMQKEQCNKSVHTVERE